MPFDWVYREVGSPLYGFHDAQLRHMFWIHPGNRALWRRLRILFHECIVDRIL